MTTLLAVPPIGTQGVLDGLAVPIDELPAQSHVAPFCALALHQSLLKGMNSLSTISVLGATASRCAHFPSTTAISPRMRPRSGNWSSELITRFALALLLFPPPSIALAKRSEFRFACLRFVY